MGKFYDEIPQSHFEWIRSQHMFWVTTAPLDAQGHINVSPKGIADCFHVVNSRQVWHEDLTGSGVETISHIRESGRVTIMFCTFEGPPRIVRLFGKGNIHEYGSTEYNGLILPTSRNPGSRAAIVVDVYQVGSPQSCGYTVPLNDFVMHRTQLSRMVGKVEEGDRVLAAARRDRQFLDQLEGHVTPLAGDDGTDDKMSKPQSPVSLRTYWMLKNLKSLDGLPGLIMAPDAVLAMTPQNNFDRDCARPMLRRGKGVTNLNTMMARDRKWFASGFVLGAVAVFGPTRLAASLKW